MGTDISGFFITLFMGFLDSCDMLITTWQNTVIVNYNSIYLTVYDLVIGILVFSIVISAFVPLVRIRLITLNNRYY